MTEARLQVLISDDGELADVREALLDLGIPFAEAPDAGDARPEAEIPLLVTTAARARGPCSESGPEAIRHNLHLVVSDAGGDALEGVPCDFLLRRPVSPDVLRLLVERARYEGPERRRTTRVALGVPVTLREDGREREAILAQLSIGGCGLVTGFALEPDTRIVLALPPELTRPRRLTVEGRVLSSRNATTADGATFDVSVAFDALRLSDRVTLRALMAGQPIDFRPQGGAKGATGAAPRRGARRRPVGGRIGVARVVIGRDLTREGMRIELDPSLASGDPIDLALYGSGSQQALLLRGRTERDPDEEAWRVHFEDVSELAAKEIEKLRGAASRDGAGFVIAEILERASV